LDAAYTLLVEEGLRLGVPLDAVLSSVEEWRAGGSVTARGSQSKAEPREKTEAELVAQNEAAMRHLQSIMPGLGI
jgi:hypothetical protein